jgi:putative transposase
MVVLPDHLHSIWNLPEGDAEFSTRWRLIKSAFSRGLAADEPISRSRAARKRVRDWQYSPFHRMVKLGLYPEDWAGDVSNDDGAFGEWS